MPTRVLCAECYGLGVVDAGSGLLVGVPADALEAGGLVVVSVALGEVGVLVESPLLAAVAVAGVADEEDDPLRLSVL